MNHPLVTAVARAWRSLGEPMPGLVVAVSGGPDSVALARALAEVGPDTPLVLAHLNHQLRGDESDADEAFVARLHSGLSPGRSLALATHRLDVAALAADRGDNLEATARRERYRWLAEVAAAHGLRHVATGHTADDQAETVLHRLLRGTGLDGLRGIAFRREVAPGVEAVRPMLETTRAQVVDYLMSLGQAARHDATNDDPRFTRNRIRHELLPLLRRDYNPRVTEALGRLAAQAAEVFEEEQRQAGEWLRRAELPRAGPLVVLDVLVLREAPRGLVRAALRRLWQREGWPTGAMGHDEYERVARLVAAESGAHDLPGGTHARRRGRVLQVGPARVG